MIVRLVRMTFREDALDEFHILFDRSSSQIRSFPGCLHLELWEDIDSPLVRTTYSHWDNIDSLEAYRRSDLFSETWKQARRLFAESASAISYHVVRSAIPPAVDR